MPTSAGVTPTFTQPHPSQVRQKNVRSKDEQLHIDALHDIATGAESPSGARQQKRQEIEKYIKTQKSTFHDVIGQHGLQVSGFNHIIKLPPSPTMVLEKGWTLEDPDFDTRQIAIESLNKMVDSNYVTKCDTFTMDEMLRNARPSQNTYQIPKVPVHGVDLHNNKVFALGSHFKTAAEIYAAVTGENSTHPERVQPDLLQDKWTWARNAWLATLMYADLGALRDKLSHADIKPPIDKALIDQIIHAGEKAQGYVTVEGPEPPGKTKPANAQLQQKLILKQKPGDSGSKLIDANDQDIELTLKYVTGILLKDQKDILGEKIESEPEKGTPSHLFSLMNALGSTAVLFTSDLKKDDKDAEHNGETNKDPNIAVFVSNATVDKDAAEMEHGDKEKHKAYVQKNMDSGPVFERVDGKYYLRMPSEETIQRMEEAKAKAEAQAAGEAAKAAEEAAKTKDPTESNKASK